MHSPIGETIFAVAGGLVVVLVGMALIRWPTRFHDLTMRQQQRLYGERAARWSAGSGSPRSVRAFGVVWVLFGLVLMAISRWVSHI